MTKKWLKKVIDKNADIDSAMEHFSNICIRQNPAKWNTDKEAKAVLHLLKAFETAGIITINC